MDHSVLRGLVHPVGAKPEGRRVGRSTTMLDLLKRLDRIGGWVVLHCLGDLKGYPSISHIPGRSKDMAETELGAMR